MDDATPSLPEVLALLQTLQARLDTVETENQALQARVSALEEENAQLREELAKQGDPPSWAKPKTPTSAIKPERKRRGRGYLHIARVEMPRCYLNGGMIWSGCACCLSCCRCLSIAR